MLIYRGVPAERPIPDLPIERPDFSLLFGPSSSAASSLTSAIKSRLGGTPPASSEPVEKPLVVGRGEDVRVTDKMTLTWVSC